MLDWDFYNHALLTSLVVTDDLNISSNGIFFDLTNESYTVVIPVVDDGLLETDEVFRAALNLTMMEDSNCVVLAPNTVEIIILDNESETWWARRAIAQCKIQSISKQDNVWPM